jgi:hypothetical protein
MFIVDEPVCRRSMGLSFETRSQLHWESFGDPGRLHLFGWQDVQSDVRQHDDV